MGPTEKKIATEDGAGVGYAADEAPPCAACMGLVGSSRCRVCSSAPVESAPAASMVRPRGRIVQEPGATGMNESNGTVTNHQYKAKALLVGAIAKAQRGEPWTDHHPADAVDAILAAAREEAERIVAAALATRDAGAGTGYAETMAPTDPTPQDLDDARAWYVQAFGMLPPAPPGADDPPRVVDLARKFAERRGTLMQLCDMQTRALLDADRAIRSLLRGCNPTSIAAEDATEDLEAVDAALAAAGLATEDDRERMRDELAKVKIAARRKG